MLKARPQGVFDPGNDVELTTENIPTSSLEDDEMLVETTMLSGDAFIRTMMDEEAYHGALSLNDAIPAIGHGKVIAAGPKAGHKVGTVVSGMMGAQTCAKIKGGGAFRHITFPFMTPNQDRRRAHHPHQDGPKSSKMPSRPKWRPPNAR